MIQITINTDNAAFDGDNKRLEIARILHGLTIAIDRDENWNIDHSEDEVVHALISLPLRDYNGNGVGICKELT